MKNFNDAKIDPDYRYFLNYDQQVNRMKLKYNLKINDINDSKKNTKYLPLL